jgi:hypothetical protein
MTSKTVPLLVMLAGTLVCGCSTYAPPVVHLSSTPLDSLKTAYVVLGPHRDPDIGRAIQDALTKHGVQVQAGPEENRPKDLSFYVEYADHWNWDMAMYLVSLNIRFKDSTSGQEIATGAFIALQGIHHGFADRRAKTFEIIDSMYNSK